MTRQNDPRLYFCRRKLHSVGPLSRREILERLLAGELDGSTLVRRADDPTLRPLAGSELAGLLTETGRIWCRWSALRNLFLLLLILPLSNAVALWSLARAGECAPHGGALPLFLAAGAGLLFWLYLVWRIVLGDTGRRRALKRVLPLALPAVQLIWVWPGYFALARVLEILHKRCGIKTDAPPTALFTASILLGYLVFFGLAGQWLNPVFQTLPAVCERIFLALVYYIVTLFSLLWADLSAMRILAYRVRRLLQSLPAAAPTADLSPLFRAEETLRRRLSRGVRLTALLLVLAGLALQIVMDYQAAAAHYREKMQRSLPAPAPLAEDWGRTVIRRMTDAQQALADAVQNDDPAEAGSRLLELAGLLRATQEEYRPSAPVPPLLCGRRLLDHGAALLGSGKLSAPELGELAQNIHHEEYRLRQCGAAALRRAFHQRLRQPMAPFRLIAVLETAEFLPGCIWRDLYEFLPGAEFANAGTPHALLPEPEGKSAALRFLVRANTLILHFRMLETALRLGCYEKERGTFPETLTELIPDYCRELPCNPLTGNILQYRKSEGDSHVEFTLAAGVWPGVPAVPCPELFAPELTVRRRRGDAE